MYGNMSQLLASTGTDLYHTQKIQCYYYKLQLISLLV